MQGSSEGKSSISLATTVGRLKDGLGREVGVSDWFVLSQGHIDSFAEVTGDRQWIHVSPQRAERESPYGGTVAHGFLTLALLSRFLAEVVQVDGLAVNYGLNRVRFPAPVRAGAKIRAHFTLASLKDVPGGVEVLYSVAVEMQNADKPACVAEWLVRYYGSQAGLKC
ncbi:MAG TPA: MaoC family dehydratase [Terriglobales bacterium]|nr:MaoC family dehydratase [Terriglobales bacterium]